jgi:hypothetical protein
MFGPVVDFEPEGLMKEQSAPGADVVPEKPVVAKEPQSFSLRLAGVQAGEVLELRAWSTGSGWKSEVVHRAGKVSARGATQEYADAAVARSVVEQLAAKAEKDGWKRKEGRGGGFARKPDLFDASHLPKPGKTAKK